MPTSYATDTTYSLTVGPTPITINVPGPATTAIFTSLGQFFVHPNGTATLPTSVVYATATVNFTTPTQLAYPTRLVPTTTYTSALTVNGGASQPISVLGSAAQTFEQLVAVLNAQVTGGSFAMVNGNLVFTNSSSLLQSSAVTLTAGTLFVALANYSSITIVAGSIGTSSFMNPPAIDIAGSSPSVTTLSLIAPTNTTVNVTFSTEAAGGGSSVTVTNFPSTSGSATGGTAATASNLAGGISNTGALTLTAGQQSALQLDASGYLKVNVSAGSAANAAAGTTGSAVPTSASYTAWNSSGNNTGVSLTSALPVQPGTGATFPVSAASLPLPTGAATNATLTGGTQVTLIGNGTTNAALKAASTAAVAADPALVVAISPNNTVAISAAALPLPSGAATNAILTGGTQLTAIGNGTNTAAIKAASTAAVATDPALVVAISPNNTVAISAASLPLPSGAATSTNVTTVQQSTTAGQSNRSIVVDSVTGVGALVQAFHNADNQIVSGSNNGLFTGGVAQIINIANNLDRQRETGVDSIPAQGISAGAANFAQAFKTSIAAATSIGTQTVTPGAMSGVIGGVAWSIQVGSVLNVDTGTNNEKIVVTATAATTFTAVFAKSHGTNTVVYGFVYNQERDAAGEADGATGIGTAVAAEYEYNGGAPGGGNFDRARSLQAKAKQTGTISSGGGSASTSLVMSATPTGLKAGMQILLYKNANFPSAGYFETVYVDLTYVEGSTTVPLASAIVNAVTYDTIAYDGFGPLGPQLNGFIPVGIGIEEEALFDPVTGLYFIERAATADAVAIQNVVMENPALYNGTTIDRSRSIIGAIAAGNAGTGTTAVEETGRLYNNITTATTTTVKSAKGYLHALSINTAVASATITIYDNTSAAAPKIMTITLPSTVGNPFVMVLDIAFQTGLTIVTSAVTDITAIYR